MFSSFERRISPFSINRIRKAKLREPLRKDPRILGVGILEAELPVEDIVDAEADLAALRRQSQADREIREPEAVRARLCLRSEGVETAVLVHVHRRHSAGEAARVEVVERDGNP